MFCPKCKAEYRSGFTRCADCDVDLVETLDANADTPRSPDGLELLWKGIHPGACGSICAALDDAEIFYKTTSSEFGILATMMQHVNFVWIEPRDRDAARAIVADVLAGRKSEDQREEDLVAESAKVNPFGLNRSVFGGPGEDNDQQSPSQAKDSPSDDGSAPDDIIENFDPDDATIEVWSGDSEDRAQTFKDCLSDVGIGCVLADDGGKTRVLVMPATEARAREVIRQIEEASKLH